METEFFYFGAILISASILALIAIRFKQSTIAGYLLAGAIARFFLEPSASFEFLAFASQFCLPPDSSGHRPNSLTLWMFLSDSPFQVMKKKGSQNIALRFINPCL